MYFFRGGNNNKIIEFRPRPHPLSPPRGRDPGLQTKITFDMFLIYCTYCIYCENSVKVSTTDLVIAKF